MVNALWAGGAEAMMLMDQRVISTSAVRCVGNTLLLQGRVYSPPFRITAIGDPSPAAARRSTSPPQVRIYRSTSTSWLRLEAAVVPRLHCRRSRLARPALARIPDSAGAPRHRTTGMTARQHTVGRPSASTRAAKPPTSSGSTGAEGPPDMTSASPAGRIARRRQLRQLRLDDRRLPDPARRRLRRPRATTRSRRTRPPGFDGVLLSPRPGHAGRGRGLPGAGPPRAPTGRCRCSGVCLGHQALGDGRSAPPSPTPTS